MRKEDMRVLKREDDQRKKERRRHEEGIERNVEWKKGHDEE